MRLWFCRRPQNRLRESHEVRLSLARSHWLQSAQRAFKERSRIAEYAEALKLVAFATLMLQLAYKHDVVSNYAAKHLRRLIDS